MFASTRDHFPQNNLYNAMKYHRLLESYDFCVYLCKVKSFYNSIV